MHGTLSKIYGSIEVVNRGAVVITKYASRTSGLMPFTDNRPGLGPGIYALTDSGLLYRILVQSTAITECLG